MTLKEWAKQDNLIMKALKVSEISHIVAKTNLGDLNFKLNKDGTENDYRFTLDAVPFEDKENKELIKLFEGSLYEAERTPEKIVFDDTVGNPEMFSTTLCNSEVIAEEGSPWTPENVHKFVPNKEDNTNGATN